MHPRLSGPPTVLRMTQSFVSSLPMPAFLPNSSLTTSTTSSCGKRIQRVQKKVKSSSCHIATCHEVRDARCDYKQTRKTLYNVGEVADPRRTIYVFQLPTAFCSILSINRCSRADALSDMLLSVLLYVDPSEGRTIS